MDDSKTRAALGQYHRLYFDAEVAFVAGAYDEINGCDVVSGKPMVGGDHVPAATAMVYSLRPVQTHLLVSYTE